MSRLDIAHSVTAAPTPTPRASGPDSAPHPRRGIRPLRDADRAFSATFIWVVVLALTAGAWLAGQFKLYTPGSNFGYYLGLVGSLFMALLLLYPLRKRVRVLQRLGELRYWFKLHMFLGIAGPVLVLYHSMMQLGSLNAAVAFYSMVIVAGSGIVGRFIYTKIHHGLYGRQANLQERNERLGMEGASVKSKFAFAPAVERRLKAIESYATDPRSEKLFGLVRLVHLAVRVRWVMWASMRDVRRIVTGAAAGRSSGPREVAERLGIARRLLRDYLGALQDVAHFRTYERLFSLWHVLHVPFVWMMVICAIVHVVAVHMY